MAVNTAIFIKATTREVLIPISSENPTSFRQCGTNFMKDGKLYHLKTRELCSQARKANIDYSPC